MINAKELRIGNWVTYHGETDMPCQLDAQDILNISTNYMHNAEIHSPIPLTPEVLDACGFRLLQKNNCHYVIDWPNQRISQQKISVFKSSGVFNVAFSNTLSGYEDYILPTEIKYLNQLQNLYFDLCGQELGYKPKV